MFHFLQRTRTHKAGQRLGSLLLISALLLQLGLPAMATTSQSPAVPGDEIADEFHPPALLPPAQAPTNADDDQTDSTGEILTASDATLAVTARYSSNRIVLSNVISGKTYTIQRSTAADGVFTTAGTATVASNQTTCQYIDETAGTATQHYYRATLDGVSTAAVQAPYDTGLNALLKTATFSRTYTGDNRTFDGTRRDVLTANEFTAVRAMSSGTVVTRAKLTATTPTIQALLGGDVGEYFIGVNTSSRLFLFRFDFGGFRANAGTGTDYADHQYHTGIYYSTGTHAQALADGSASTLFACGTNAPGFFSQAKPSPTTLAVGGGFAGNGLWNGEISYVLVTPELMSTAEVTALSVANADPILTGVTVHLSGLIAPLSSDAAVGTISFRGPQAAEGVATLVSEAGDNSKFKIENGVLKTATTLTAGQSYTVVISSGVAGSPDQTFTITAEQALVGTARAGYANVMLTWPALSGATYSLYHGATEAEALAATEPLAAGVVTNSYTHTVGTDRDPLFYRIDVVSGSVTVKGAAFTPAQATGKAALIANAIYYKDFSGDTSFDGTRIVALTEAEFDRIKVLTAGTILTQFRYTGDTSSNRMSTLLGMGSASANTGSNYFTYGVSVDVGNAANSTMRYEWVGGLKAYSAPGGTGPDQKWHTAALVDSASLIFASTDGGSGTGRFTDSRWDGFLSRVANPTSFAIGGFQSDRPADLPSVPYVNFVGDVAYLLITDEVLTEAQANTLTASEQQNFPALKAVGNAVAAGQSNALVGEVTLTWDNATSPTVQLAPPAADNNNDKFKLEGTKLYTTEGLLLKTSYTVAFLCTATDKPLETLTLTVKTMDGERPFYAYDASGSGWFRIPALLTLNNGDIMAAIDARFGGTADSPNNLDTTVNFKRLGAENWEGATLPNHFKDYPDADGYKNASASFIDPEIVQLPADHEKYPNRIYMLVDAYAYGASIGTGAGTNGGFVTVDEKPHMALTTGDRNDFATFDLYLEKNSAPIGVGDAYTVRKLADKTATTYTTDAHFNLYKSGVAQTTTQIGSMLTIPLNIFYAASPVKPCSTDFLWLNHSDDMGKTWSAPTIIGNDQRTPANGKFLGVGPGVGIVVKAGPYAGRIVFNVYDNGGEGGERASGLYSDDGGDTWTLGTRTTMATTNGPGKSSESQIIELPDGTLRMYARSAAGNIGYTDSTDGGHTWLPMVQDPSLPYGGGGNGCQISVINYSKPIDGKPAIVLASPGGPDPRTNGSIRIGLITAHPEATGLGRYTVDWKYTYAINGVGADAGVKQAYAYSCITELKNGDIAVLYEEDIGNTAVPGASMGYKTYTLDALTKGGLVSMTTKSATYNPGETMEVDLVFDRPIDTATIAGTLSIQYPGTSFPDGTLTYLSNSVDLKTLTFNAVLPASNKGYAYTVTLPPTLVLKGTDGTRIRFTTTSTLPGTIGSIPDLPTVEIAPRYLSNRITFIEGTAVPTDYALQRATAADGTYTTIATLQPGKVSYEYIDETAGVGTKYFYRISLTGLSKTTDPIQASHQTGLDALLETAVLQKIYTTDKDFTSGTRVDILADSTTNTATFNAVKSLTSGTIVTMAQLSGTTPTAYTSILGSNSPDCFLGIHSSGGSLRFTFGDSKASVSGSNYAGAGYHTGVYTYDGTTALAAMDGLTVSYNLSKAFFAGVSGITAITAGGNKDGATLSQVFNGKIAYLLITNEILSTAEALALSQCTDFPEKDTHPDIIFGQNFPSMYNSNPDNTWVFTGGTSTQGTFADTKGTRSYMGHFEEYIRWTKASSTQISRQRHVMGAGKINQDVHATLANFDSRIAPLDPKTVVYLVGKEDWIKGEAGIDAFKSSLNSLITKARTLRGGTGLFAVQTPYAVANTADNANAALYAQAARDVMYARTSDKANLLLVDHYLQTNNTTFTSSHVNANGTLNPKGHLELGRQLAVTLFGSDSGYPTSPAPAPNFPNDQVPVTAPASYSALPATVTATANGLTVAIPADQTASSWRYTLQFSAYTIEGLAQGKTFAITQLPEGAAYTLSLAAADDSVALPTLTGTVTSGVAATIPTKNLTTPQQALATLVKGTSPLTWIFTGDSITHGAKWLLGYDSTAQSVEKFLKDDLGRTDDVVINTANSGATSQDIVDNLTQRITKFDADVVTLMIGTNDASNKIVPIATYKKNLETMLTTIETMGAIAILRTPIPSTAAGGNRNVNIPEYVDAAKAVAASYPNTIVVDQYAHWNSLLTDSPYLWEKLFGETANFIHPNPTGHMVMTHQFLRDTGLWRDESLIGNLTYQIPQTTATSAITPTIITTNTGFTLDASALATQYGTPLSAITVVAISESGTRYTITGAPTGTLAMTPLPVAESYLVTVTAQQKSSATTVSFAPQTVRPGEPIPVVFDVMLDNLFPSVLTVGGTVGTLSVSATAPAGTYTYTLVAGDGDADNAHFSITGTGLTVAQPLIGGQVYHIRVQATDGTHKTATTFTLTALSSGRIFREENVSITGTTMVDLTSKPYANQMYQMESGTIIIQYVQTAPGALLGIANGGAGKGGNHFQFYTMDGANNRGGTDALGIEVRNANGTNAFDYGSERNRIVTGRIRRVYENMPATNTVAITADKTAGVYKIFANGALVFTIDAQALGGYKFLKDIEGLSSLTLGGVMRNDAPAYTGFTGTLNYIEAYATPLTDAEVLTITGATDMGGYIFQAGDTSNSNYFRIPAITTMADGTVVSAIDSRHGGTEDSPNNIDIAVSRSTDGGTTWSKPTMPLHFDDFLDNPQKIFDNAAVKISDSASYIDPILVAATNSKTGTERLFLMADAFPSGGHTTNCAAGSGFKSINGVNYQLLKKSGDSTYDYTIRANGVIYNDATNSPTQYSVNSKFQLLDGTTPLTIKQKRADLDAAGKVFTTTETNVDVAMNIMYAGALFTPVATSYLYLSYSDDGGLSWSDPMNLNGMVKPAEAMFFGVGPGRGHQIKNGDHAGRILLTVYEVKGPGNNQCRVIYSDDFGATWQSGARIALGNSPTMTESQVVEMPDGSLRIFARTTGSKIAMSASTDGGATWTAGALQPELPLASGSGCQLSVINYDGLIDGKHALVLSAPIDASRKNGIVRIGLIEEDPNATGVARYTINWAYSYSVNGAAEYFAYSCLTQLPNGVGLIYENANTKQPIDVVRFLPLTISKLKGHATVDIAVTSAQEKTWGTVSGGGNWNLAAMATVTAIPAPGYRFVAWQNSDQEPLSTSATYQFVATKSITLTAVFQKAPDTTPPTTPTNLVTSGITTSSATVAWTAATDTVGVVGYEIAVTGATTATVTATTHTFTGLTPDTAYTATVVAKDAAGNTSPEATVTFRTNPVPVVPDTFGHVTFHDSTPAPALAVTISQGASVVAHETTNASGTFPLPASKGAYMLTIQVSPGVTYTQPFSIPLITPLVIVLPDGNLGSSLTVEDSDKIPAIVVDGLNDLFDESDKALVKSDPAYSVSYKLSVSVANDRPEIDAIKTAAAGKTMSTLLDITLSKTTVTGTSITVDIAAPSQLLEITIPVDAAWSGKVLTIYRYHKGSVDAITTQKNANGEFLQVVDSSLLLHARKFSTYAVAYSDVPSGGGGGGGVSSHTQFTITATAEGGGTISPATTKAYVGSNVTFTIKPNKGMTLRQLLLDGKPVATADINALGAYTYVLKNVQSAHTLRAIFMSAADDVLKNFDDLHSHWAREAIRFTVETSLMQGTSSTTFAPNGQTDRATAAMIVYRLAGTPTVTGRTPFADVSADAWYASAVAWAHQQGIVHGVNATTFAPQQPVTRQELAVLFYRYTAFAEGNTLGNAVKMDSYSDSAQIAPWAREAMAWAVEQGIFGGSDNASLLPTQTATRGELAVILQRLHALLAAPLN